MTAEQVGRAARRRWGRTNTAAVVVVAIIIVLGIALILLLLLPTGETSERYRLRATTMIPTEIYLADDAPCPSVPSPSPFDFRAESALADELVVYEGELVAVRIAVSPNGGPIPSDVQFQASWPTDVIESNGPVCAFVVDDVDDEGDASSLTWRRSGPASASFDLRPTNRFASNEIEVWLVAADPPLAATMLTRLETTEVSDDIVVEMLGGRLAVGRRDGTPAIVELVSDSDRADGASVDVVAVVSNTTEDSRSFDVGMRLESSLDGVGWATDETLDPAVSCTPGVVLSCQLPDLGPGGRIEIPVSIQIPGSAPPETVSCGSQGRSVGMCVSAFVTTDITRGRSPSTRSAEMLFDRAGASVGELAIFPDPPTVVRLPDAGTVTRLLVTSGSEGDIASIEIVGSDCDEIERVAGDADDGDAFLASDEIWSFNCVLGVNAPAEFRVDIAGTDGDGRRVTGTYRGTIESVDPDVSFVFDVQPSGRTEVTLTNVGRGSLFDVAVLLPGCEIYESPDVDRLAEGAQLSVACASGDVVERDTVVYGTHAGGGAFVIRNEG